MRVRPKAEVVFQICVFLAACTAVPSSARGDDPPLDEPGVSPAPPRGIPATRPAPVAPTAPPPTAAPPASPAASSAVVIRARQVCRPGSDCPLFPRLVRELASPASGAAAADVLGQLGDPRSILPLALCAAYGVTPMVKAAATAALTRLVQLPSAHPAARAQALGNPDPVLRQLLITALGPGRVPDDAYPLAGQPLRVRDGVQPPGEGREPADSGSAYGRFDPAHSRAVWGHTAFGQKSGSWSATSYNIGYWLLNYGVNDYLEVGVHASLPVLVLAFMPYAKVSVPLSDSVKLGVHFGAGVVYPYLDNSQEHRYVAYGGGPVLSIGNPDLFFNVGVKVYGLTVGEEDQIWNSNTQSLTREIDHNSSWLVAPHIGFGWRFHRRLKLNVELYAPFVEGVDLEGEIWALMYGLRIFGERIFGDISFALPFFPDSWDIMKYVPMGFPMLAFGFTW